MKINVVRKGEKIAMPIHVTGAKDCFWSMIEAPDNGIVITLTAREQQSGGLFINEFRLTELLTLIDVEKADSENKCLGCGKIIGTLIRRANGLCDKCYADLLLDEMETETSLAFGNCAFCDSPTVSPDNICLDCREDYRK